MLADLPPTPGPSEPTLSAARVVSPKKSQKRSPKPVKAKSSRKVSLGSPSKKKALAEAPYETEVIPPSISAPVPFALPPPKVAPMSLLPTTFSLPPPSPHALFPSQPSLLLSQAAPLDLQKETLPMDDPQPEQKVSIVPPPAQPTTPEPARCPFPMAKPLASRMVHAYSPVRPSPLSRILMLGNSPNSPEFQSTLEPLHESSEEMFPEIPQPQPQMSLAQELGIPESPPEPVRPESPLREKKVQPNVSVKGPTTAKGRVIVKPGKEKAKPAPVRGPAGRKLEKENATKKTSHSTSSATGVASVSSRSRLIAQIPPGAKSKSAPRRVLVGSAEAKRS